MLQCAMSCVLQYFSIWKVLLDRLHHITSILRNWSSEIESRVLEQPDEVVSVQRNCSHFVALQFPLEEHHAHVMKLTVSCPIFWFLLETVLPELGYDISPPLPPWPGFHWDVGKQVPHHPESQTQWCLRLGVTTAIFPSPVVLTKATDTWSWREQWRYPAPAHHTLSQCYFADEDNLNNVSFMTRARM